MPRSLPALLALLAATAPAHADMQDVLRRALELQAARTGEPLPAAALSQTDMVAGLREALAKGTRRAIAELGRPNGFLENAEVAIPMPDGLKRVEKVLRGLRQDKLADEFVATLNHAAEQAVPEAAALFSYAVSQMSPEDALGILKGPEDAATQYFRKTSGAKLLEAFRPIVQTATAQAGVTSAYKRLMKKAGPLAQLAGKDATDLDGYVTEQAVDGLFTLIAAEEKRIRQDPLARTSELLRKVFGAIGK